MVGVVVWSSAPEYEKAAERGSGGLGDRGKGLNPGEWTVVCGVTFAIRAIYEGGKLRPLEPLELAEHTVVQISVVTADEDSDRREWLDQGQRTLMGVWDNEADNIYNVLLTQ